MLTCITILGQSGSKNNGNEAVLHVLELQDWNLTFRCSLISYLGPLLHESDACFYYDVLSHYNLLSLSSHLLRAGAVGNSKFAKSLELN